MKPLRTHHVVRILSYLIGLLLFATGCNWFGVSSPFVMPDEPLGAGNSAQEAQTANPAGIVAPTATPVEGTAQSPSPDVSGVTEIEATTEAIIAQLKQSGTTSTESEVRATADAIIAQLGQVGEEAEEEQPPAGQQRVFQQGVIQDDLVNVRSGPDTGYPIVAQVSAGQTLGVTGRNEAGDWWQVCCPAPNEEQGWLLASLLAMPAPPSDALEAIPVADAPEPAAAASSASSGAQANVGQANVGQAGTGFVAGIPANGGFPAPGGTNPLTGLSLPGGRGSQRPVIVCINNDFAARPQFGTSQADIMYEYLMEGYGITRFSGVYYGSDAAQIGPVRSARLINVYMEALYDAGLACSGASDGVRFILKRESPFPYMDVDLDDPSNVRYSTNVGSDYRTRLRTDTAKLSRFLSDWGAQKPAAIRGFTFGGLSSGGASATIVNIPYPGSSRSGYQYDSGRGLYLRNMGGSPHVDGNSGTQLALENVIVQYVPHQTTDIVEDSLGSLSIRLNLFGTGRAIVFRDGQALDGTWRSDTGGDMPRFFGADGREIALKPGRSWISVVPLSYGISYQ